MAPGNPIGWLLRPSLRPQGLRFIFPPWITAVSISWQGGIFREEEVGGLNLVPVDNLSFPRWWEQPQTLLPWSLVSEKVGGGLAPVLALPCARGVCASPARNVASFFLFLRGGWGGFPGSPFPTRVTFSPRVGCPHFRQVEASLAFSTQVGQCPFLPPPCVSLWVSLLLSPSSW